MLVGSPTAMRFVVESITFSRIDRLQRERALNCKSIGLVLVNATGEQMSKVYVEHKKENGLFGYMRVLKL